MIPEDTTAKDYTLILYSKTEIEDMNTLESTRVDTQLDLKSVKSDEGSPSGVATLDTSGKHVVVEIPISSNVDAVDDTNNITVMSPEMVHYLIGVKNIEALYGRMSGQFGATYSLTATAQDVVNYVDTEVHGNSVDSVTGEIILVVDRIQRVYVSINMAYITSTSGRNVTVEIYDVNGGVVASSYIKHIAVNTTEDSMSMSFSLPSTAGNVHKLRLKASEAMDLTFESISFDIETI